MLCLGHTPQESELPLLLPLPLLWGVDPREGSLVVWSAAHRSGLLHQLQETDLSTVDLQLVQDAVACLGGHENFLQQINDVVKLPPPPQDCLAQPHSVLRAGLVGGGWEAGRCPLFQALVVLRCL